MHLASKVRWVRFVCTLHHVPVLQLAVGSAGRGADDRRVGLSKPFDASALPLIYACMLALVLRLYNESFKRVVHVQRAFASNRANDLAAPAPPGSKVSEQVCFGLVGRATGRRLRWVGMSYVR